jgi:pyruvate dehydrogenase E2 component (dihydrolipoamide acetyltransferase)
LRTFSAQAKALSDQARDGSLDLHSAGDATFTVTNLGAYGIESFTPILNTPQVAILGINAIMVKPVLGKDSAMNLEQRITFSLTVDHAVIDGGTAARYLQALVAYIENIDLAILAEGSPYG